MMFKLQGGRTALIVAAEEGRVEMVKVLLGAGAAVDAMDVVGYR